jgi:alkanesulfonate monooxygenase SsuD/methylene tetrahydromethanopterin reductase-like flavin-dependent oxidoreductase (luciferase family)
MAQLGIQLPIFDPLNSGQPRPVTEAARLMEEHGFDQIWCGDHLWCPAPNIDAITAMAAAAVVTSEIALGFSVLLLGLHHTPWTAKQLTTIDQLSGGRRLTLGVGVGGEFDKEFELAGVATNRRGRALDTALDALPGLLTEELHPPISQLPKIYAGGRGEPAIQRAARRGDGWMPIWVSPKRIAAGRQQLAELAAEHGRPTPRIALVLGACVDEDESRAVSEADRYARGQYGMPYENVAKYNPAGAPARVAEYIEQQSQAGVDEFVLMPMGADPLAQIERLAEVRALLPS